MLVLLGALVAGVLTTLAPCVLPLLPVVVGGSLGAGTLHGPRRALIVTAGLAASVVLFSLLLKATTALIDIPMQVWAGLSGGLLVALGLINLFPRLWEWVAERLDLMQRSTGRLAGARGRNGTVGALLTGAALGPVFSSCSPFYAYIVVTALPAEPAWGLVLLLAYTAGLSVTLLAVALLGQRLIARLGWAADANGWLRRGLGLVFIAVGLAVMTGLDRALQTWIVANTPLAPWLLDGSLIPAP